MLVRTKSKKGLMKTVVTIFAVLLIVLVFIIFVFLFRLSAKNRTGAIETGFSSIDTELLLKNFLRTPVHSRGGYDMRMNPPKDLTPSVGETITYADLVSWSCNNNKKDPNYKALKESINSFFDDIYGDDWNLEIWYSDPELDKKGFGHKNLLKYVKKKIERGVTAASLAHLWHTKLINPSLALKLFLVPYREEGFGSQIIPCKEKGLARVVLKSHKAFFEII